jgi:hypothetical protein
MGEQDTRIDPKTGFYFSDPRMKDARQNDGYVNPSTPAETARDYSRPHTIPALEFEAATGRDHGEAIEEYKAAQEHNRREAEKAARAAEQAAQ